MTHNKNIFFIPDKVGREAGEPSLGPAIWDVYGEENVGVIEGFNKKSAKKKNAYSSVNGTTYSKFEVIELVGVLFLYIL